MPTDAKKNNRFLAELIFVQVKMGLGSFFLALIGLVGGIKVVSILITDLCF